MSLTVWKYQLQTTDIQDVLMPQGADILCVQTQGQEPCLWALVNPDAEKGMRRIYIVGTGHPTGYLTGLSYIGTYQLRGGALVFHVFA